MGLGQLLPATRVAFPPWLSQMTTSRSPTGTTNFSTPVIRMGPMAVMPTAPTAVIRMAPTAVIRMGPIPVIPTAAIADTSDAWVIRRALHPDAPRLEDLLDDVEGFRTTSVYRHPLINDPSRRRDPDRFARTETLWGDLLGRSIRRPQFRLVAEGATARPSAVTRKARIGDNDLSDLSAPNRIITGYRNGATVVLQGLHLSDPHLARFANNLALQLDQPVQINAYLSPVSARGLQVHFDYHDVFVVQLEGTKHWRVWAPTEQSVDPVGGKHRLPQPKVDELGEPEMDLVLEPGDVLYLPRGHPHVAETTDCSSAHLTVGLLAITWHRVVRRAIDDQITRGGLRSSIPLSTLEPTVELTLESTLGSTLDSDAYRNVPGSWNEDDSVLDFAITDSINGLNLDLGSVDVRRWVASEIWERQASTRLRPLSACSAQVVDGPLEVTPGPLLTLSRTGSQSVLFAGDRTITMPSEAHEFLASILRSSGPFTRSELPGLDDGSATVVISRLLDEGLLAPSGHGAQSNTHRPNTPTGQGLLR